MQVLKQVPKCIFLIIIYYTKHIKNRYNHTPFFIVILNLNINKTKTLSRKRIRYKY